MAAHGVSPCLDSPGYRVAGVFAGAISLALHLHDKAPYGELVLFLTALPEEAREVRHRERGHIVRE